MLVVPKRSKQTCSQTSSYTPRYTLNRNTNVVYEHEWVYERIGPQHYSEYLEGRSRAGGGSYLGKLFATQP